MSLLERTWRLIRAQIRELSERGEDPEAVLEQTVLEMQQNLIEMRQAVAIAIATQKRTERQVAQNNAIAQQWRQRAQLALEKGEESLAREALTRGQSYQNSSRTLAEQIEQHRSVVHRLKQEMRALEDKIAAARNKKDLFIARARSAAVSQKMRELNGSVDSGSAVSAFERMEEKVLTLEAQSEAAAVGTDDLEEKFAALENTPNPDFPMNQMSGKLSDAESLSNSQQE
ncbi:MAG: PspA/IM30 family protein [Cyanophyceae cyanobacterium]